MSNESASLVSATESSTAASVRRKPVPGTAFAELPPAQRSPFTTAENSTTVNGTYEPVASGPVASADAAHDGAPTAAQTWNRPPRGHRRPVRQLWTLWKWEILALIVACISLIAIIVVLRVFNHQDVATWKGPFTINAGVAILSAIFKGSLALPISDGIGQLKWLWFTDKRRNLADMHRYDQASRSVWGCIVLVATFVQRLELSPVAAFGALLTLLSLAVDPFSQASVSTQNCMRKRPVSNIIPRAANFSDHFLEPTYGSDGYRASVGVQIALSSGMTQAPANSSVGMMSSVNCASTNCSLTTHEGGGVFTTLTMCHTCLDVAEELTSVYENGTQNANADPRTTYVYNHTSSDPKENVSTKATIHYNADWAASLQTISYIPLGMSAPAAIGLKQRTRLLADGPWEDTSIAGFQAIFPVPENRTCDSRETLKFKCGYKPVAVDCVLRPCVKAYKGGVSRGVYRETEVDKWYLHWVGFENAILSELPQGTFQIGLNQTYVNGTLRDCLPQPAPSATHPIPVSQPVNQKIQFATQARFLWYPKECVHAIDSPTTQAIGQFFFMHLDNVYDDNKLLAGTTPQSSIGPAWLVQLYNKSHVSVSSIDKFVEGIATSLGTYIRTSNSGEWYNGSSFVPQDGVDRFVPGYELDSHTCIRARWKYLAFPAVLLVAELIFFGAVVTLNARGGWDGDWKSSTVPLLFQDVDVPPRPTATGGGEDASAATAHESELRAAIGNVQVRLVPDDSRNGLWRLSTKEDS